MQTAALAAYVESRKMRFAGAPVTLKKLLQMWQLPHDGGETIDGTALEGVARYCKLTVDELTAAVEAMIPPATFVGYQTVTVPGIGLVELSAPVRLPGLPPEKLTPPDPTTEIPKEQLGDLIDASRRSSPVIEGPTELSGPEPDEHDIDISFDEVEPTPLPTAPSAPSTTDGTKSADAKSGKSKKNRKKKS